MASITRKEGLSLTKYKALIYYVYLYVLCMMALGVYVLFKGYCCLLPTDNGNGVSSTNILKSEHPNLWMHVVAHSGYP